MMSAAHHGVHCPTSLLTFVTNGAIFVDRLRQLLGAPSAENLAALFLTCKGLLASVRHGGRARLEAVNRTLRNRFHLWRTGAVAELWKRLHEDHKKRSPAAKKHDEDQLQREAKRVARLVDQGLLSRAATQLSSRGLAPHNTDTILKLGSLFPHTTNNLGDPRPDSPSFSI